MAKREGNHDIRDYGKTKTHRTISRNKAPKTNGEHSKILKQPTLNHILANIRKQQQATPISRGVRNGTSASLLSRGVRKKVGHRSGEDKPRVPTVTEEEVKLHDSAAILKNSYSHKLNSSPKKIKDCSVENQENHGYNIINKPIEAKKNLDKRGKCFVLNQLQNYSNETSSLTGDGMNSENSSCNSAYTDTGTNSQNVELNIAQKPELNTGTNSQNPELSCIDTETNSRSSELSCIKIGTNPELVYINTDELLAELSDCEKIII